LLDSLLQELKMKIICAGFPKTGTKSMALALRELGYSVHDFEEHLVLHLDDFVNYFEGKTDSGPLIHKFKHIDAVVDQPACLIWRTLLEHYPDAKVILTVRSSPDVWFDSCVRMIDFFKANYCFWFDKYTPYLSPTRAKCETFNRHIVARLGGVMGNIWEPNYKMSPENWINGYVLHNAAVKQLVPPEQLLVFQAGDGWDNLCRFLDKKVPGRPFPKENVTGEVGNIVDKLHELDFVKRIMIELAQNLFLLVTLLAALGAILYSTLL